MIYILYALTIFAFIAVVVSLVLGGLAMQSKSDDARAKSNKWMQRRVIFQALAIVMLFITVTVKAKGG